MLLITAAAPDPNTTVAEQDRGYLIADNLMVNSTQEYSSANPIFVGYVADTYLVHNTIHDTKYSGICAGWGWGLSSYTRNIQIENNSITKVMQLLSDGGGVYAHNQPAVYCDLLGYILTDCFVVAGTPTHRAPTATSPAIISRTIRTSMVASVRTQAIRCCL